jgi:H2-forming N5,N10-methylenetetrahydromethanopterin dehydrogenase-like enzyme
MQQVGITKHVVEHIYEEAQPCTTCALPKVPILQMNVVAEDTT